MRPMRFGRLLWPVLPIAISSALLLSTSGKGPDFGHYVDWARVFFHGDIFQYRHSNVLSPMGVPFTIWSHGSGLLFVLGKLAIGRLAGYESGFDLGAFLVGWLASLVFWWAMVRILDRAAEGNTILTLFGLGAAFLGTLAGFYSHMHATESLSYAFVSVLVWQVLKQREQRLIDALVVGAATGLLLGIRSYLMIFALPVVGLLGFRIVRGHHKGRMGYTLTAAMMLLMPIALGGLQVAFVNRWMTASFLESPYVFGSGSFRSLNWVQPELIAVLLHPLHGLVPYHPLYVVGFVALIVLFVRVDSLVTRLMCVVAGLGVLATLYTQAAYYTWWLGIDTFGARSMATTTVVLVPALIRVIADDRRRGRRGAGAWLLLTIVAVVWSFPLLAREQTTSYFSYRELFAAQAEALDIILASWPLLAIGVVIVVSAMAVGTVAGWLEPARIRHHATLLNFGTVLFGALFVGYMLSRIVLNPNPTLIWLGVGVVVGAVVGWFIDLTLNRSEQRRRVRVESIVNWGVVISFVAALVAFANLTFRTERLIASAEPPPREFKYAADFPVEAALLAYYEYGDIRGFEDKKAALLEFLQAESVVPAYVAPLPESGTEATFREPREQEAAMRLLAHELTAMALEAGETLTISLTWQSAAQMSTDWSVFVHVIDGDGIIVAQLDTYPGQGVLRTSSLETGLSWRDDFAIRLPATAYAPNTASVYVGWYDQETGERMLLNGGQADTLEVGALQVNPSGQADLPNPSAISFGDEIRLVGYALNTRVLSPGESLVLDLYWRGIQPMDTDYTVFTHVIGPDTTIWGQVDSQPQGGEAPTSAWQVDELIEDRYLLTLREDTPPGQYQVEVGLYAIDDGGSPSRLPLDTEEGRPGEDAVLLSPIRVVAP